MMKLIVGFILGLVAGIVAVLVYTVNEMHPDPFDPSDEWDGRRL